MRHDVGVHRREQVDEVTDRQTGTPSKTDPGSGSGELGRGTTDGETSVDKHDHVVGKGLHIVESMRREQDRSARILQAPDDLQDRIAPLGIKPSRGFVQNQQTWIRDHRPGQFEALNLASGHPANGDTASGVEPDPTKIHCRVHPATVQSAEVGDPGRRSSRGVGAPCLEHDADLTPGDGPGGGLSPDPDLSGPHRAQPENGLDRRGLAGAVRAEQAQDPPLREGEVEIVDDRRAAVADGQTANLQGLRHASILGSRYRSPTCQDGEFRNNSVVKVAKFPGVAAERIARSILTAGPATAPELARRLELTAAAIRRTLMSLVQAGLVESSERPPFGPSPTRGRGRPGQIFSLTNAGRAALGQAYDGLALQALRFLQRTAGDEAITSFARDWAAGHLTRGESATVDSSTGHASYSVETVAARLNEAGFAVTVHPVGSHSVQLCQHACPVSDAAAAFPALCEAETAVLSDALGRHVTRLATIAHGDGVCTTLIPTDVTARIPVVAEHAPRTAPEREVMA